MEMEVFVPVDDSVPEILKSKFERHFVARQQKENGGIHPLKSRFRPDESSIIIDNNDYLSLTNHPEIIRAQINALEKQKRSYMMSSIYLQDESPHSKLEKKFANFLGVEASILTQSGYVSNYGLIQCIADGNTPVYIDMRAHGSLWDGIQLAKARPCPIPPNDVEKLERFVKANGPGIIVVDSVYSSNGAVCPLVEIIAVAKRNNCILVVDESHSLGVYGDEGRGMCYQLGVTDQVDFITASLAKAFAGRAGLIACSRKFREYYPFNARANIFSTALGLVDLAGLDKTLDVIKNSEYLRDRLHYNADYLRNEIAALGYNIDYSQSQIISLEAGTERKTRILADALESKGVFGAVFCSPATPKNGALVRFSVNASLDQFQLDQIVQACEIIREDVGLNRWPSTIRKYGLT